MKYLVLVLSVVAVPLTVRAGNLDAVFVSDQAAMMGGAVTALASDTTAIYYNPAGLAADTSHTSVSLSTSSYGFSTRASPSIVPTGLAARRSDLTTTQVLSAPAAIAFFVPLNERLGLGLGIFVPVAVNSWTRDGTRLTNGTASFDATFENRQVVNAFRVGGGLGYALTDKLRVGGGLFLDYTVGTLHLDFAGVTASDGTTTAVSQVSANDELTQLGGIATLGVQYQPTPQLVIGATWILPELQLTHQDRLSEEAVEAGAGSLAAATTFQHISRGIENAGNSRVFLGVGYRLASLRLAVEGNYTKPQHDLGKSDLWNLRIGGQVQVVEGIWLGAGFFTDRSPERFDADNLLSQSIDYYGGTFGVRLESRYLARLLKSWTGTSEENESGLLFFTALTGRYARGTGKTAVIGIDVSGEAGPRGVDVAVNEVSAQLSTGIAF